MKKLIGSAALILALACGGQAPQAAPDIVYGDHPHALPMMGQHPRALVSTGGGAPHLTYYGGKVVSAPKVIVVFWGSGVNATTVAQISGFFASVTNSVYLDWLSEYNTPTQSIGRGTLGGTVTISPANIAPVLTNQDIQTELAGQIAAGHLPKPDDNTIYMTYFPPTVVIALDATDYSCVQFCAYHNTMKVNGQNVYYGVMPDLSVGGCSLGCGGAATAFQNLTSVSSHELVETMTDAEVGLAANVGPPLAWYDTSNGEIGDICNAQQGTVTGSDGRTWTVQKQWSNQANACIVNK